MLLYRLKAMPVISFCEMGFNGTGNGDGGLCFVAMETSGTSRVRSCSPCPKLLMQQTPLSTPEIEINMGVQFKSKL